MNRLIFKSLFYLFTVLTAMNTPANEWSGYLGTEFRYFTQDPRDPGQHDENLSLVFEPEFYHEWDKGTQSLAFVPFFRLDQHDNERTHFDIRELTWLKVAENWELRVGLRKVFWGVIEFQHLVDIINQTDLVENIDTEDKLGQPMINLALINDWGTIDLFVLPYFIEAPLSVDELEEICKRVEYPKFVNMLTFGKTPILSAAELEEMGFKIVVNPIDSILLTAKAMREMAEIFKRDGHTQSLTEKMVDFDEIKEILGLKKYLSLKEDLEK